MPVGNAVWNRLPTPQKSCSDFVNTVVGLYCRCFRPHPRMVVARRANPHANRRSPHLLVELLETRRLMVAEGEVFSLSRSLDSMPLAGSYSAVVNWGDGKSSAATVTPSQLTSKITARVDYSLDTTGFFSASSRRQLFQASLDAILARLTDTLSAIQPSGSNSWTASFDHPSQAGVTATRNNLSIAENEILIFAGARPMASPQIGQGGFGGFQAAGSAAFLNTVQSRGQGTTSGSAATDIGPWGGSISFNSNTNWYFGADPAGVASNQQDFVSVAKHELLHVLGFGTAPSWHRLVSGQSFTGSNSRAQYDGTGNVPLSSDRGHWQFSLQDGGVETLMDPDQLSGIRKNPTPLDMAGLRDIGWNLGSSTILVTASHTYADNGQYPASVTVTGSRLGKVESSLIANITNAPPSVTVPANQSAVAGQQFTIPNIGRISDPGFRNTSANPATDETFTYVINWGDNSPNRTGDARIDQIGNATRPTLASFDGSHAYATPGNYTVSVTVRDDDGGVATRSFTINVQSPPSLTLVSNRQRVVEDGSVKATLTLTRIGGNVSQPLTVNLTSGDTTEATVPASVTFAAGISTLNFELQPVDDNLLDGDQTVTITASATGLAPVSVNIVVGDAEFLTATTSTPSVREDAGARSIAFRVSRSNTDVSLPLTISISGNDPTLARPVPQVVIPAGLQQVEFRMDAVDDNIPELTKSLRLTFSAVGYTGASATVSILDDEPPKFQNPENPLDVNDDGRIIPLDALVVINYINRQAGVVLLDPEGSLNLPFLDVNGDYSVTPIDALIIINAINRGQGGTGEGESALEGLLASQSSPGAFSSVNTGEDSSGWSRSIDQMFFEEEEKRWQRADRYWAGIKHSRGT